MGKSSRSWIKDVLAVLLAFAGMGFALLMMLQGELMSQTPLGAVISPEVKQSTIEGIKLYFMGIGGAILLSSIAYILVGQDDTVKTTVPDTSKRQ
jgi:hypothetical protein